MKLISHFSPIRNLRGLSALAVSLGMGFLVASSQARPVPQNLAGGLGELVASNLAVKGGAQPAFDGYTTRRAASYAGLAIRDQATGRFLVDIFPRSQNMKAPQLATLLASKFSSFTLTALDKNYHGVGMVEGYVSLDDVPAVGNMREVRSVILEMKPMVNKAVSPLESGTSIQPGTTVPLLGTAFDQGVYQHRVDQINKFYNSKAALDYEGKGMSIGCLSDSYNSPSFNGSAATDVANFDLPGASSNPVNTQPVVVLRDVTNGTNEGRGMVQIAYKMAPKARLAFATGDTGEVGFANNIRALAGLAGYTYPPDIQQGFAADTICDDLGYDDEPFFEDGIIAAAVDDVFAAGVSYFSSSGNDIGTYDYDSEYRNVPNTPDALNGTNINLTGVPSNLYQGGFHNFNNNPGQQDIAQTVHVINNSELPATNFQWDDPYNQLPDYDPTPIFTQHSVYAGTPQTFTTPSLTAGNAYFITVVADQGSAFDAIVTVKDPNGNVIVNMQDTGTDEFITITAQVTGDYTIIVSAYGGTTGGYTVSVYNIKDLRVISTDFNLLVFDLEGNYLPDSSLVADNYATNSPFEYGLTPPKLGENEVQYVIARSTIPTDPHPAHHVRWIIRGNGLSGIGPAEYLTINTPNTKGHAMANGSNGTAAYSVFRPSIPEFYTSPGPATVYFDNEGRRLKTPEVRLQPGIAAADNANTSFFGGDSSSDIDTKPNFGGTSAAGPHAAAIGALVLEAHGGPHSVTPSQMMNILHNSCFSHNTHPNHASALATTTKGGQIRISIDYDYGLNPSSGTNNPNSIFVSYHGPGTVSTLVFNQHGTAADAGNPTGGNNGLDATNTYFSNLYPGLIFAPDSKPFTLGDSDVPLSAITVGYSHQAPLPSVKGQFWTMSLTFSNGRFASGDILRFTVGHGPQHNSQVTNGTDADGGATSTSLTQADLFGGITLLPDGSSSRRGMQFSGTMSDGSTFQGTINTPLSHGWSPTDGYGFIDAEKAVK
ncbi:MAG TPA: hypothetical protein VGG02_09250 [Chthoniobacterales bacterium]